LLGSAHVFAFAVSDVTEARLLREVAGDRVSISQLKLLKLVAIKDSHSVSDVAPFLGVSNAAASKAVDKLARRKFLRRDEAEKDRRVIHLSLTPAGRKILEACDQAKERKLATLFRHVSSEDMRRTADLLDRLSTGIVDHHAQAGEMCMQCGLYFCERCLLRQVMRRTCCYKRHKNGNHQAMKNPEFSGKESPTHIPVVRQNLEPHRKLADLSRPPVA
jgi:DNA-binding MarR family transcriptional regulator